MLGWVSYVARGLLYKHTAHEMPESMISELLPPKNLPP